MVTRIQSIVGAYVPAPIRICGVLFTLIFVLWFFGLDSWRTTDTASIPWFIYACSSLALGHDVAYLYGWRGYKLYATAFYCWFAYLWMLWGWSENELGSAKWWFDAFGHMLFPAVTIQFLLIRLSVQNPYRWRKERFEVEEKTFFYALCFAVAWEIVEMFIDGLQSFLGWWEFLLQKGDIDTISDIAWIIPFGIFSIWLRRVYEWKVKRVNPTGMEEVDTEMLILEELVEQRDTTDVDIAGQVACIRLLQKQNLTVFTRPLRERFARVLRRRKRKRRNVYEKDRYL